MDVDPSRSGRPPGPWAGIALLTTLWFGVLAVTVWWWESASPWYDVTARVRGIPDGAANDADWLSRTTGRLVSDRSLLQAAESLAGREPSPTAAELAAFHDALKIGIRRAASGEPSLVLHYAGSLPQGPALVEALARRFARSQSPREPLPVDLTDASVAGIDFRVWAVGLLVVLAVCCGGWAIVWWTDRDRPLVSAGQAQALLGVPVLALGWRQWQQREMSKHK